MDDGALVDDLVADYLDTLTRVAQVATEGVQRLDAYPALAERYGPGGLRLILQWGGPVGRRTRAEYHRQLADRGMSQRQIAAVTGVDHKTVGRDLGGASAPPATQSHAQTETDDGASAPPASKTLPPPDDRWRALDGIAKSIRDMKAAPAHEIAAAVPERRRAGTARTLRELGTYLGSIALALEEMAA